MYPNNSSQRNYFPPPPNSQQFPGFPAQNQNFQPQAPPLDFAQAFYHKYQNCKNYEYYNGWDSNETIKQLEKELAKIVYVPKQTQIDPTLERNKKSSQINN